MRKSALKVGERYAVRESWAEREYGEFPLHLHRQLEIVELAARAPHPDERLTVYTTRYDTARSVNADAEEDRPLGISARKVNEAGVLEGPPIWYDSARLFIETWANWEDLLALAGRRFLLVEQHRRKSAETEEVEENDRRFRVGYVERVRVTGMRTSPFEPKSPLVPGTLVRLDGVRGELDVLGRAPMTDEQQGAIVELDSGGEVWVGDYHHLVPDPDQRNEKMRNDISDAQRRANLGRVCEAQAMEMRLGRWAPSGNRYHDRADFDDRKDEYAAMPDRNWLMYRPDAVNGGTIEVGLETMVALLSLDDRTRERFIEQISDVIAGISHAEPL